MENLISQLPPMLSGDELTERKTILWGLDLIKNAGQ